MSAEPDLFGTTESTAVLSEDGVYRYVLTRRWRPGQSLTWVMLNPSTADAEKDDPTIRRCIGFAKTWGYDAICVVNLFALRATDPSDLAVAEDPVGPDNDHWIRTHASNTATIAAWGAYPAARERADRLRAAGVMSPELRCLGVTSSGAPRHPLYVRGDAAPVSWPVELTCTCDGPYDAHPGFGHHPTCDLNSGGQP